MTVTEVSSVSVPKASHVASGTSFLATTHCSVPVPSRSTTNATFPDERRCITQPERVTVWPTRPGRSAMRMMGSDADIRRVTERETGPRKLGPPVPPGKRAAERGALPFRSVHERARA